jgi:hypothetical protein
MALECPLCSKIVKDARGAFGHLKWSHDLRGEELDEAFEEMKTNHVDMPEPEPKMSLREALRNVDLPGEDDVGVSDDENDEVVGSRQLAALLDRINTVESRLRILKRCEDPTASFGWTSEYDELLSDLRSHRRELFNKIQNKLAEELDE